MIVDVEAAIQQGSNEAERQAIADKRDEVKTFFELRKFCDKIMF